MRIAKYIHSCLTVESDGNKILFDPGKFTFVEGRVGPDEFKDLSAIILTHYHPDHIDDDALRTIVQNNDDARVMANSEIAEKLRGLGIRVEVFEDGLRNFSSFRLRAVEARHAPIVSAEIPQNTAYIVNDLLLHPGDSMAYSLDQYAGTPILALPLMAPWATESDTVGFACRMNPKQVIPIHDGYAKDFFLKSRYDNFEKYFSKKGIRFERLEQPGDAVRVREQGESVLEL